MDIGENQKRTLHMELYQAQCKEQSPSPRAWHTGWQHEGKLWIFGGYGDSPKGYLNYKEDTDGHLEEASNNQLLCYDPNTQKWSNPQCFSDVPSPRSSHANAIINNKAWLFGGYCHRHYHDDVFELTMHSLTWTQIQTFKPQPRAYHLCMLTAVTEDKLVSQGRIYGPDGQEQTWIIDLQSHSWRLYRSGTDNFHEGYTGSSGLNNSVIMFGGYGSQDQGHFSIRHWNLSSYNNWQCK